MLRDGEHIEPLGGGLSIIVSDIHHFSTDTILLAHFSGQNRSKSACELGTGCGAITMLWAKYGKISHIDSVDIQPNATDMLTRTVQMNNLCDKINVINENMLNLRGILKLGSYDLVACNPPYKLSGTGIVNPNDSKATARHETQCTIDDVTAVASGLLNFSGRFCMCQRPERLTDVLISMRKNNLEPKRLRFVQQRKDKSPKLFLIEGRKGGRAGFMNVEPTLFIEDELGNFSDEMIQIYGNYRG